MNVARQSFAAVRLANNQVLVAGGFASIVLPGGSELLRAVAYTEVYDPVTGTWTNRTAMTEVRNEPAATVLADSSVLVTGGSYSMTAEIYDPQTNIWTAVAPMADSRQGHTATLLPDGRVFVAGGFTSSGNAISAEIFDPLSGVWTPVANMIDARSDHAATLLADGRVLVVGGTGQASLGRRAEIYDLVSNTWTATTDLAHRRYAATATLLDDGRVLVVGGFTAIPEIYDPGTGTWATGNAAMVVRKNHTATRLPGGTILFAGGDGPGSNDELASVESYDPNTNLFSLVSSMAQVRTRHSAVLLDNGEVLVAGGATFGSDCCLATAERFGFGPGPVTFEVNTVDDTIDVLPGDGLCSDGVACSLRAAIMEANTLPGLNNVILPAGHYTLSRQSPLSGEENGDLNVLDALELVGAGAQQTVIDAQGIDRVLSVGTGQIVELRGITFINGLSTSLGGGLYNTGVLTVYDSEIRSNVSLSTFGGGGGLYASGRTTLVGVTVSENQAISGGGVANVGEMTIVNSTLSGNLAVAPAGSGVAPSRGGGVTNDSLFGSLTMIHSTVTNNVADEGGGVVNACGKELCSVAALSSTIVANNSAPVGPDCVSESGSFGSGLRSEDFNLIGDVSGCPFNARPGDLIGMTASLAPLSHYGGTTRTHALLPASLARDQIPAAACAQAVDQRGTLRPQGAGCDTGAYEAAACTLKLDARSAGTQSVQLNLVIGSQTPGQLRLLARIGTTLVPLSVSPLPVVDPPIVVQPLLPRPATTVAIIAVLDNSSTRCVDFSLTR